VEETLDEVKDRALELQKQFEAPKVLSAQLVAAIRNLGAEQAQRLVNCLIPSAETRIV